MHWKTAWAQTLPKDQNTIIHQKSGKTLHFPAYTASIQLVSAGFCDTHVLGEVALPVPIVDQQAIESLLRDTGLSPLGWIPGRNNFMSPYHDLDTFLSLLQHTRQMVQERNNADISIEDLRNACPCEERIFTLHLLTLLEDQQGLVAENPENPTMVRLATWREALQVSFQRSERAVKRTGEGKRIQPRAELRLDGNHVCWSLVAYDGEYSLSQLQSPYTVLRGNAAAIDHCLREYLIPQGWAATDGMKARA